MGITTVTLRYDFYILLKQNVKITQDDYDYSSGYDANVGERCVGRIGIMLWSGNNKVMLVRLGEIQVDKRDNKVMLVRLGEIQVDKRNNKVMRVRLGEI